MSKNDNLSNKDLRELIIERLREIDIDTELIQIDVHDGSKVTLGGEADFSRERDLIIQTIFEIVWVEDIKDHMIIMEDEDYAFRLEGMELERSGDLFDEDNECIGTEDVFRAVEDGMPYIPPTTSSFDKENNNAEKRKHYRR